MRCSPLLLVSSLLLTSCIIIGVQADFGDYVDPTFNCPATTTCPIVCVAEGSSCPEALSCKNLGDSLCLDGTCSPDCTEANEAFDPEGSPCPGCTPVVCPKVDLPYDTCLEAFGSYYNETTVCAEAEEEAADKEFTLRETGFIIIYCWVCIVFAMMFIWCAFNQIMSPVPGSTQSLSAEVVNGDSSSTWTQTGYSAGNLHTGSAGLGGIIGMIIYFLVVITLFGFQFLLAALTVFYYIQQGAITWFSPVFENEIQVLKVHEITWGVAFFLTLLLKWPVSIISLFLRRSTLEAATHVVVIAPIDQDREGEKISSARLDGFRRFLSDTVKCINSVMRVIFSDVSMKEEHTRTVCKVSTDSSSGVRYFYFRLRRYNFDSESGVFVPGKCSVGTFIGDFLNATNGISTPDAELEKSVVGRNIIQMNKPNVVMTVLREFSKPFYIYQVFMIWTWFPLWYYYMACVQAFIVSTGGLVVSFFQFRNEKNLYRITQIEGQVSVLRDGECVLINQKQLVPRDVVFVKPGLAYADMIVIEANHLLVDEAALTGESTPIAKVPCDRNEESEIYSYSAHKKHVISAGTRIIEVEGRALAVVLATGSHTSKGELLREILSYRRHKFKFDIEVKIVVFILFLYSIFGFWLVVALYKDDFVYEWFYGMFVVGTCLPPLLPTVFTVSVGISDDRLARKQIACVNSEDILVAGKVKMVFFDKTGTLTKQGLDFIKSNDITTDGKLSLAMASCHSLTVSSTGNLVGNAVDMTMFGAASAKMKSKGIFELNDGSNVKMLKKFDFDHHRMTQSVIVEINNNFFVFVKGSGESIKKLCLADTIPPDFDETLSQSAREGVYQINFAMKKLATFSSEEIINRDDIEYDLDFIGSVDFKNQLREATPGVLQELEDGAINSVMVTGDHTLTGICIAKEAGLIKSGQRVILSKLSTDGLVVWLDEDNNSVSIPSNNEILEKECALAVTGETWRTLLDSSSEYDIREFSRHIRVFGRCTPNDKVSVVNYFVQEGITCCMVGDGGNDCGALKTCHVGIALSDAEASIVAPFTSLEKNISSVVEVLKEGRCALASALASYKYMIMYGQVESINQIINAYYSVTFHEWCWVFMDGVWMISMAFTLPLAHAEKHLSPKRPTSSLIGPNTMSSAVGVLIINFLFTCLALGLLTGQDWYQCRKWGSTDISNITLIGDNYEASVIFIVTGYQYISSAMAYNFGFSFRAAWWKNYVFVTLCCVYTVIHFTATLYPSKLSCFWRLNCTNENVVPAVTDTSIPINNAFNTTVMPEDFRIKLVVIMVSNAIAVAGWAFFVGNVSSKVRMNTNKKASQIDEVVVAAVDEQRDA